MVWSKDELKAKIGIKRCVNTETGELVCELVDLRDPSIEFRVAAAQDSDGSIRITGIESTKNFIPEDDYENIQKLITKLVRGKIPIEE